MLRTYERWRDSAKHRFSSPMTDLDRLLARSLLAAGEPIVIDQTVLKVEPCDWPQPHSAGFQFFAQNQCGAEICEFGDGGTLDHPGECASMEACRIAVAWAERQMVLPSCATECEARCMRKLEQDSSDRAFSQYQEDRQSSGWK